MNADESEAEDRFVEFDAPYVLGALSTQDRATYEAHLAGCAHCQARVRELQDVPALLRTVPAEAVEALSVTMPSATAAASRTQPRWRRVGAGLAVAAAMATALALVATSDDRLPSEDDRSPATVVIQFQPVGNVPLTANVRLTSVDWGTKIDFECSLYEATDTGRAYSLVVRGRDGQDVQVAGWLALANRSLRVPGSTAVAAHDIVALEVRAPDGTPVLVAQL